MLTPNVLGLVINAGEDWLLFALKVMFPLIFVNGIKSGNCL